MFGWDIISGSVLPWHLRSDALCVHCVCCGQCFEQVLRYQFCIWECEAIDFLVILRSSFSAGKALLACRLMPSKSRERLIESNPSKTGALTN